MSTRGMIARVEGDGFRGVYHHFDSYPDALGANLWRLCQQTKDLDALLTFFIDEHKGGWSTINNKDFSKQPGYVELNHYTTPAGFDHAAYEANDQPQCYCHGDRSEEGDMRMTQDTADWLFIEWAYAIDPVARTFAVIEGCVPTDKTHLQTNFDGRQYEEKVYTFRLRAVFHLDGPEPNWQIFNEDEDAQVPVSVDA